MAKKTGSDAWLGVLSSLSVLCTVLVGCVIAILVYIRWTRWYATTTPPPPPPPASTSKKSSAKVTVPKYTPYTGPFPTAAWPEFANTVVVGRVLKTQRANAIDTCKKSCHAMKECTHVEVHYDGKGDPWCVSKSFQLPRECQQLRQRCSDGRRTHMDKLYVHPYRDVQSHSYALNVAKGMDARYKPITCNWKCQLLKLAHIVIGVVGFAFAPAAAPLGELAALAADFALQAGFTAADYAVTDEELKVEKKREELMAKGEPYDTAIVQGIPYKEPRRTCPAQDRRCTKNISLVEALAMLDDAKNRKQSEWDAMSREDRIDAYKKLKSLETKIAAYTKLPCDINCADVSLYKPSTQQTRVLRDTYDGIGRFFIQ